MKLSLFLIIAFLAAAQPAGDAAFQHWTSAELKSSLASASGAFAAQPLGNWGNHNAQISRRTANGEAEIHESFVDFFVVEAGEASLIVGGKVVDPRTTAPGEIRGKSIEGGQKKDLKPGDIVRIAANTPHQLLVPRNFLYYVIKVRQ